MKNVEDIYPLSPMQEVMLLHALTHVDADALFNQFCFAIDAPVDVAAFKSAWTKIIARHAAMRTSFVWEGVRRPLQIVRKSVRPDFAMLDWRHLEPDEQKQRFAQFLEEDRRKGFDPSRAPLTRFGLAQIDDDRWWFVWSSHHLIIDRWCLGQLFAEFDRHYSDPAPLDRGDSAAPSFRRYIDWLQRQERAKAYDYWRSTLRGFTRPVELAAPGSGREIRGSHLIETAVVSGAQLDELRRFTRARGLTLSTLFHGAWALTLNRLMGRQDVVFGATVSGRPADIPDVESIVGSFINNVPVRVTMPADAGIHDWLTDIKTASFQRLAFEYLAPSEIQSASEIPESAAMFDTLCVWLSGNDYPTSLPMRALSAEYATAFPLTISVAEATDSLTLRAVSRRDCVMSLSAIMRELKASLDALLKAADDTTIGDLPGFRRDAEFAASSSGPEPISPAAARAASFESAPIETVRGREKLALDVLTELLAAEWSSVLAIDDLRRDEDFFEIGGTSLQAARLHARIERATRQSLPMLALFRSPTIEGMAKTIFDEDWPVYVDTSIALRSTGRGIPLFCIASPEVNTAGYALLMRHLPDQQDLYVLQAPPASDDLRRLEPSALPSFAEKYIEAMREIRPRGPYRMLGMCAGSHIALEMTRQLEADNERVDFLGIISTWGLYTVSRLYYVNRLISVLKYYAGRVWDLLPLPGRAAPAALETAAQHRVGNHEAVAQPSEEAAGLGSAWISDVGFESLDPGRPRIATEVTVFRIRTRPFWRIRDEGLGWSKQASTVSVVYLPTDSHEAVMREPVIRHLATAIRSRLEVVEDEAGEPGTHDQLAIEMEHA